MKKRILIMIVVLSAVLSQKQIIAQENINYKFDDRSIANLVLGIESGNYGLQKSCIYLAGKYKLNNLVDEFFMIALLEIRIEVVIWEHTEKESDVTLTLEYLI